MALSIFIDNLRVSTIVGVYEHEQHTPQELRFDLEMRLPDTRVNQSALLADTIDYAAVSALIPELLATQHFRLLENMAHYLAVALCRRFHCVEMRIRIAKHGVVPNTDAVGVNYFYQQDK
ncbi:MAG: Dihydroneopterin aldolase [Pseudomonadota bacterium]|jgi:dihydroneopterin aldolase